ncbi:hypothetical protein M422DRAFT_774712 [Sphaerobolus stellatus SS14]|nr:hypothetical protein M422DRAFT_774712 [Sphaerobolus stellatus SS14]
MSSMEILKLWLSSDQTFTLPFANFLKRVLENLVKTMPRDFRKPNACIMLAFLTDMSEWFQKILQKSDFNPTHVFMDIAYSELDRLLNHSKTAEDSPDSENNKEFEPVIQRQADPDPPTHGKDSTFGCIRGIRKPGKFA